MKRSQTIALLLIVLTCLLLSALLANSFYRRERRETLAGFNAQVDELALLFGQELSLHFESLYLLKALFDGSAEVLDDEFSLVANETMARNPDILALGWIPRVAAPSATEPAFPLRYFAAGSRRSELLGVDLASVPAVRQTLQAALQEGDLQASDLLPFFPEEPEILGMLALLPIFEAGQEKNDQTPLRGLVVGFFPVGDLLARLIDDLAMDHFRLTLVDDSAALSQRVVYSHGERVVAAAATYRKRLPVMAGRQLTLLGRPSDGYLVRHSSRSPQLILLSGFLFTLLLAAYLRMLATRAAEVERLVVSRTRKLHEANDKLANLSMTDGLTGIANRRNFDSHLEVEWKRAIREQQPLALILVDIDCFKHYNDHYGHLQGDNCLRRVAQTLHDQTSRPRDLVARYGGEEFALILPHTNHAASALGEACRAAVEALGEPHAASAVASRVTVSVGVASLVPHRDSKPAELIARADQALYQAKKSGRNRVVLAS